MPEIEVRPSTPENQVQKPEEHLVTEKEFVEQEIVDTEETKPRRSREEKVLEVLESGEFIHKISPHVRRKFVSPAGWKFSCDKLEITLSIDWIGNKASAVAKWMRESDESKSLDIRERQKVKKILTSLDTIQ